MGDELVLREADLTGFDVPKGDVYSSICGPCDIAFINSRRNAVASGAGAKKVPVDIFAFAFGESPTRHATKIGGLPYRPKGLAWPKSATGDSLTFLAQFCFAHSHDLDGLPGEVLLLFVIDESLADEDAVAFEWYPLGIPEEDLVAADEVMPPSWEFVTCHGYRYRTEEWIEADEPASALAKWRATKIGGLPSGEAQWPPNADTSGRFIAQVAALSPLSNAPFPWVNHPQKIPIEEIEFRHGLSLGDAGTLMLYYDEGCHAVHWTFQYD